MAIGRGNGKLLLFGEHSAVYGKPAVGIALPLVLEVSVEIETSGGVRVRSMKSEDAAEFEKFCSFIDGQDLPFKTPPHCTISVSSSIPRALGLGSSAALSVALVRAFADTPDDLSYNEIWNHAHVVERYFHGTPSGIDTGLALLGGTRAFFPEPPAIPLARRLEGFQTNLVIGTVRRETSTKALVSKIRSLVDSGESSTIDRLGLLGDTAEQAIHMLDGNGDSYTIGSLADRTHSLLGELGLSTELLDQILSRGKKLGATGGKLSGAGGGGAFFLVCATCATANEVTSALSRWIKREQIPASILGAFQVGESDETTGTCE